MSTIVVAGSRLSTLPRNINQRQLRRAGPFLQLRIRNCHIRIARAGISFRTNPGTGSPGCPKQIHRTANAALSGITLLVTARKNC